MVHARNEELWMKAEKRAGFKRHFISYIVFNIILWIVWFFTTRLKNIGGLPWPAYSTIFWGIAVFLNYLNVYVFYKNNLAEREYLKLLKEAEEKEKKANHEV